MQIIFMNVFLQNAHLNEDIWIIKTTDAWDLQIPIDLNWAFNKPINIKDWIAETVLFCGFIIFVHLIWHISWNYEIRLFQINSGHYFSDRHLYLLLCCGVDADHQSTQ